jgi:adenine phosphoribosyltransferase
MIDFIRTVPDYPHVGVNFYDLNSLFSSPVWSTCINDLANKCSKDYSYITNIVGIESRGFVVGAALAHALRLPFTMIRKDGSKYPGNVFTQSYDLEYGHDTLVLQQGILGHVSRVLIADDLIATGGSILAAKSLIEQTEATVLGYAAVLNLAYLNNLENITALRTIT